jgi:glycosyltransferase involved in cell wall biosynthesis/SAM-dependent methyltransferase
MSGAGGSSTPRIGILVVAYNAESTLGSTLDRIPAEFLHRVEEIVVADDASGDDTFGVGVRWRSSNPQAPVTVIRHLENRGYGGNQKAGYRLAMERGLDIVVMLHADGQYAPEHLPEIVRPIVEGRADAVFGSRMLERGAARRGGMPLYKLVGNRILTRVENALLGTDLSEFHSGYRAYSVAALAELPFDENTDDFDFDTQIIVQLIDAGKRIVEVPIPTYYGDEICYVDGIKYAKDVVRDVAQYRTSKLGFGTARWVPTPTAYSLKSDDDSSHSTVLEIIDRIRPGQKILDVGCSSGLLAEQVRRRGHYVAGVDVAEEAGVRERVDDFHLWDLDRGVPDVDGHFDVVIAADVIEHVREPVALLRDLAATLVPGGLMIVSTPNFGHWYSRGRVATGTFDYDRRGILDEGHLRFFTRRGFLRTVREAGLVLDELSYTGLPLGVLQPGVRRSVKRVVRAIDRALVRLRPTLFGYQFVATLHTRNFESVTDHRPRRHPRG